jgi:lipid II:glycine glycyltransferase (peptidoglycan interpeptide bridge formation enzyme)
MNFLLRDQLTGEEARVLGEFVQRNPHCHLFQHPDWTWVSGRTRQSKRLYFWAEEEGQVKVSALVNRTQMPGLRWARDSVERGPVGADPALLRLATAELARQLQARGSVSLTVNPYWTLPEAEGIEADLMSMGFRPFLRRNGPHAHSLVIDLTPGEEEIARSFRKGTRAKIRKAESMGLAVSPAQCEEDIAAFYRLYKLAAALRGYESLDFGYLMRLWQRFLADQEHGICLIARYQGEVVSADIVLKHGTRAEDTHGPSRLDRWPDLPKNHRCVWEAVKWAKARGCKAYDLGGYLPEATEGSQVAGVNQFKMGFSSTRVDLVGEHRCVFNPTGHQLLTKLATAWHRVRTSVRGL